MTVKTRDNLVSGGISLVSVFLLLWVIPTYTPPYPGYGVSSALLPNLVFGVILALSVLSLGSNIFFHYRAKLSDSEKDRPVEEENRSEDNVHLWHLTSFIIPCILLMPAMQWMGFIPAGLLFMLLIQFLCGQRKLFTIGIVAVCTVGAMYLAMRYGLGIPMP
jgi:hypothetical protein